MDNTTTPKRSDAPKGEYKAGIFHHVMSVADFADTIGVEARTIKLIEPTNEACKTNKCPFNAIAGNRGFCALHCQSWYPKASEMGNAMYGTEFLRRNNVNNRRCNCDMKTCHAAGYFPHQNSVEIPSLMRPTALNAGALFSSEKLNGYLNNPSKRMFLYPWHFLPEHLVKTADNKWALPKYDKTKQYRDRERLCCCWRGEEVDSLMVPRRLRCCWSLLLLCSVIIERLKMQIMV